MIATLMKKQKTSCELVRLKTVVNLKSIREIGNAFSDNYIGLENIEPWTGLLLPSSETDGQLNSEDPEIKSIVSSFEAGDILFGKLRPYLAKAYLAQKSGVCSTELLVIEPSGRLDGKFLKDVILTSEFINAVNAETYGVKMPRADWNTISNLLIPLPPLSQQRQIADYLDCETAKLDALIAAKQRLLTLLAEKRRAMITQAVTRGLNADVPMQDSGIEWLGKIPKNWEIVQLRRLVKSIEQGWSPQADDKEPDANEWGVLKLNAVKNGQFDSAKAKTIPSNLEIPHNLEVKAGDFLITRANTPELVGDVCYVEQTKPHLILSDLIYRIQLKEKQISGRFLSYFLQSPAGRSQIQADARGSSSSMVKLSQGHILDWLLLIPSLKEQQRIVTYISLKTKEIDKLIETASQAIALLLERRAATISAAVTGQIEIPSYDYAN